MAIDESLSEIAGGPLATTNSVFSHLEHGLRKSPHDVALICMHQSATHLSKLVPIDHEFQRGIDGRRIEHLTLTYTQLHDAAMVLAAGMVANGVQPGSTILTLIPNGGEYGLLLWTCTIMRLTFSSFDPSALDASGKPELRRMMQTLEPDIVIVPDLAGAKALDASINDLGLKQLLRISLEGNGEVLNGWKSFLSLAADGSKFPVDETSLLDDARNDNPERIHSVLFTSGTSAGQPKGCPQRTGSMAHVLHSQAWLISPEGDSAVQRVLVQPHNSRAIVPALTLQTWRAGAAVVMPNTGSFAIQHTLDAIDQLGVDFIVLTPAMIHALAQNLEAPHQAKLDSVRAIHLGGDAVTKDVLTRCAALFPSARVFLNHGMSEGGGFFKWPFFHTPINQIPCFGEICPIGIVAQGTRLRIWDADQGAVLKRGEPGELHVCSNSIIRNYLGNVSASSFYEDEGRWFNTGDIGMMNSDGLIFILGRAKDVIKRAGTAIVPAVLESCIEKYTGTQVSVISISHPTLGHEPFAVVEKLKAGGKSADEIEKHVLSIFGQDYKLGGLVSLRQIGLDKFPINATHKIVKFEVQRAVLKYLSTIDS